MGIFTYSLDVPSEDPVENKRLGYRVPRSVLLPPYLYQNPYFVQYMEALDEVLGPNIDEKINILRNLRNMWPTDPDLEAKIYDNSVSDDPQMFDDSEWPQFERPIVVRQVNMLGMNLQSAGLISDKQYQQISRWVGQYWYGKGTQSFIDFMNYCLGTSLTVERLWTQNYQDFLPDGDPGIGTPIWDGGTWYPTSHVQIEAAGGLEFLSPQDLITFFYEIANYNLVLQSVDFRFDLTFVDTLHQNETSAAIVATGLWADNVIVMSNYARYGASAPPVYDTGPAVSTSGLVSADPGMPMQLMAAPSSWIVLDGNKLVPVYSESDMVPTDGPDIPTSVMGPPQALPSVGDYQLLYGPSNWVPVPNSTRSTARIPAWSRTPQVKSVAQVPTAMVGQSRDYILANPAGFADLTGAGYLVPYWNL